MVLRVASQNIAQDADHGVVWADAMRTFNAVLFTA